MQFDDCDAHAIEHLRGLLSARLEQEFGERGKRVAEMLETASGLLTQQVQYPYQATAIAACIRQAVQDIIEGNTIKRNAVKSVSSQVIAAKKGYLEAAGISDAKRHQQDLFDKVDRLKEIFGYRSVHRYSLKAMIKARTGSRPQADSESLLRMYKQLISSLNRLVHRSSDVQQDEPPLVRDCYENAIRFLAQIFLPAKRLHEINQLADLSDPQSNDADLLKKAVTDEHDLDYFASRMRSPAWFDVMDQGMLKSPTGAAPWGLRSIARHLKDDHRNAFIAMVNENFNRWSADDKGLVEMGYVGYILGDRGFSLLIKALRMDSSDASLCHYARLACLNADPSSPEMAKMADRLMNHDTNIQEYHKTKTIPARLVKGMDLSSCEERIKILASSLSKDSTH